MFFLFVKGNYLVGSFLLHFWKASFPQLRGSPGVGVFCNLFDGKHILILCFD